MNSERVEIEYSPELNEIINRLSKEYDINLAVCRDAVLYMFRVLKLQARDRTLESVRFLKLGTWGVSTKKYERYKRIWKVN